MPDFKIHPFDTLFFRDGKPFTMGENSVAHGIFPPSPSIFLGAFRSLYFSENSDKLSLADKADDPTRDFAIQQLAIIHDQKVYFPAPLDLVKLKNQDRNSEGQAFFLNESTNKAHLSSNPLPNILKWQSEEEIEPLENLSYLDENQFKKYQKGENPRFFELGKCIKEEPKVGNKIDHKTGTTEENMLYRIGMKRMGYIPHKSKELSEILTGFAVSVHCNGYTFQNVLLRLGGEGKFAYGEQFYFPAYNDFPLPPDGQFKLYLSTPAIFKNGWLPETISPDTLEGSINGIPVRIRAAAVGKPLYLGGWSWAKKAPKPMFKAVPQGSVYYLELTDPKFSTEEIIEKLQRNSISDLRKQEGFGIAYLANIQKE